MAMDTGGLGRQYIYGNSSSDNLYDTDYETTIYAYHGNDKIFVGHAPASAGMPGFPTIIDYYYMGTGVDTVSYDQLSLSSSVTAHLGTGGGSFTSPNGFITYEQIFDSVENLTGSDNDDSFVGNNFDNVLKGGDGDDYLSGAGGNDEIHGGDDDDEIRGGIGHDDLFGGFGDDEIEGGSGNDEIEGGHGEDIIDGESGVDVIYGDAGDDTIDGAGDGHAIFGCFGKDTFYCGSVGDDIEDGDNHDVIDGGSGNDDIFGQAGNDTITGGLGNDDIDGGSGTDTAVYTGNGDVTVDLFAGVASGAQGNDTLVNIERVMTAEGNDTVFGQFGVDNVIYTLGGNDTIYTMTGENTVFAGSGNDTVLAYHEDDVILGEAGNDTIYAGLGDDSINAGADNDDVRGGSGADDITLGSGTDTLRYVNGDASGTDNVFDFELGTDKVLFQDGFLSQNVAPGGDYGGLVFAFPAAGGDSLLMADTLEAGWKAVAKFHDVSANELGDAIEDGSLFEGLVQINPIFEELTNDFEFVML